MGGCESKSKNRGTEMASAPKPTNAGMDESVQRGRRDEKEGERGKNIFGQAVEIDNNFVAPVFPKTDAQSDLISAAAKGTLLFKDCDAPTLKSIVDAMESFTAPSGTTIIEQGETGDYFYVVEKGTVGFYVDSQEVGKSTSGQGFGELALMYDCPRAATCKALDGPCDLWRVDQVLCKQVLASATMKAESKALNVVKKVTLLEDLDPVYLASIADALIDIPFEKGDVIMNKGDAGDVFYIVKEGIVKLTNIGLGESKFDDQELSVGKAFGERALVTGDVRAADAIAFTDCVLLALTAEKFHELLGPLDELLEETLIRRILRSVPMIARSNPTARELSRLVSQHMKQVTFDVGQVIRREGEIYEDPSLYVIRDGKVSLENTEGEKKTLAKGDYFGDTAIAAGAFNFTITCLEKVTCKKVSKTEIKKVCGNDMRFISVNLSASTKANMNTIDLTATMENLEKKSILGSGTFGKVWLVKHKVSGAAYALKVQKKYDIIKYKQTAGVVREKKVMEMFSHPFVIGMVNAFQDKSRLYMVLKMYPGGELYSVLHSKRKDGVAKASAVFYAAGVLEALDVMHQQNVIYRDLKPENVLLDAEGYCVIVDMGFAKVVKDKTYTLCGTPLYIAPEVILSKGHNKAADIWSLGVLIFEMIYGFTPFYVDGIDQMGLFKSIVRGNFKFPHYISDKETMDIVTRMLHRRPAYRLGCLKDGAQDLRDHPFFTGLDFSELVQKKIKAPWKPKLKNPFDTKHFDDWSHLEQEEGRDPKLSNQQQDLFKEF